jgi:hypothetical protein
VSPRAWVDLYMCAPVRTYKVLSLHLLSDAILPISFHPLLANLSTTIAELVSVLLEKTAVLQQAPGPLSDLWDSKYDIMG